jgi:pyruvate formate lyase activating enzyme
MTFHGIKKVSLIDYPEKIACTLFTKGCNLRCPFCHNPELVNPGKKDLKTIRQKQLLDFLKMRKKKLDGIVITGGEPLMHGEDLLELLYLVKQMGFKVKVDTNGTYPEMVEQLLKDELADYIAMDFKTSAKNYCKMKPVNNKKVYPKVLQSLETLRHSSIDYEIRTTVVPTLHDEAVIEDMAEVLKGSQRFVIQNFVPAQTLDPKFEKIKSFKEEELKSFKQIYHKYIKDVQIRLNV